VAASNGAQPVIAWIGGVRGTGRGKVTVWRSWQPQKPIDLGAAGAEPTLVDLSISARGTIGVIWTAGNGDRVALKAALIHTSRQETFDVAVGAIADPSIAFINHVPWASWSEAGAIKVQRLSGESVKPIQLVSSNESAFWPILRRMQRGALLSFLSARRGGGYDLRFSTAQGIEDLGRQTHRLPQHPALSRIEPSLEASASSGLVAWSEVVPLQRADEAPIPPHIHLALVRPNNAIEHFERKIAGVAPAVAPADEGGALAWLKPAQGANATVHFSIVRREGRSISPLVLGQADARGGRPSLAKSENGYSLAWASPEDAQVSTIKLAQIVCRD
jgi:hypothetical protein